MKRIVKVFRDTSEYRDILTSIQPLNLQIIVVVKEEMSWVKRLFTDRYTIQIFNPGNTLTFTDKVSNYIISQIDTNVMILKTNAELLIDDLRYNNGELQDEYMTVQFRNMKPHKVINKIE